MTKKFVPDVPPKCLKEIVEAIGGLEQWAHNCHACSLAIIRTRLLPSTARIARGFHSQVRSQHSWVVIGDPYDDKATILDGTLWSYTKTKPVLFCGKSIKYAPHGKGSIWAYGRPPPPSKPIIPLAVELSQEAQRFMDHTAPGGLDFRGWAVLANAPVHGWPSTEIITAMYNTPELRGLLRIDIVGMITDLNPGGLYQ